MKRVSGRQDNTTKMARHITAGLIKLVSIIANTTVLDNLTHQEIFEHVLCADRNLQHCPEWKALYIESRSSCFHHTVKVQTHNIGTTRSECMKSTVS